jgi:hypothetical protein
MGQVNSRLVENRQKAVLTKEDHKVVVVGGSHARVCAVE